MVVCIFYMFILSLILTKYATLLLLYLKRNALVISKWMWYTPVIEPLLLWNNRCLSKLGVVNSSLAFWKNSLKCRICIPVICSLKKLLADYCCRDCKHLLCVRIEIQTLRTFICIIVKYFLEWVVSGWWNGLPVFYTMIEASVRAALLFCSNARHGWMDGW